MQRAHQNKSSPSVHSHAPSSHTATCSSPSHSSAWRAAEKGSVSVWSHPPEMAHTSELCVPKGPRPDPAGSSWGLAPPWWSQVMMSSQLLGPRLLIPRPQARGFPAPGLKDPKALVVSMFLEQTPVTVQPLSASARSGHVYREPTLPPLPQWTPGSNKASCTNPQSTAGTIPQPRRHSQT